MWIDCGPGLYYKHTIIGIVCDKNKENQIFVIQQEDLYSSRIYDHREGVKNLLSPEESKESLEMALDSWKKRTKLESKIGKGKYVLAEYEKIKRITIP